MGSRAHTFEFPSVTISETSFTDMWWKELSVPFPVMDAERDEMWWLLVDGNSYGILSIFC